MPEPDRSHPDPRAEETLREATTGSREAFQRLMAAHHDRVSRAIRQGLGPNLRAVVSPDDVLQDVWISAYRDVQKTRFRSPRAFTGWLETLVRHRLADLARRHLGTIKRRHPRLSLDETIGDGEGGARRRGQFVVSHGRTPSSLVSTREEVENLEQVLDRIPAGAGDVLRLHFLAGLGVRAIADRLETSEAAVRRRLDRALQACRKVLDGERAGPRDGESAHGSV